MATTTTTVAATVVRAISQSQEFWHTDANCFQEKGGVSGEEEEDEEDEEDNEKRGK